jgi:arylsulfatase A-like enzyme
MQEGQQSWFYGKETRAEQRAAENTAQMPWNRGFDVCRIGYSFGLNPYCPHQIETGDTTEIPLPENKDVDDAYMSKNYHSASMYDAQGRFVDKAGADSSHLRYAEDIYREEAVRFIQENKARPFFLYYATPLMHGPLAVKELGEFKDKPAPWTPSHKVWAAEARELDKSVGMIVAEVKRLGIERNTIILFASDNGYAEWCYSQRANWTDNPLFQNKGPWNRGKFMNANGGVIVPFIAWGPGRVKPGRTDRAIDFYDFIATASDLAKVPTPGLTDGVSFVPLLEGRDKDQPLRATLLWPKEGNYGIEIPDDFAAKESAKYLPPSVLLDERWYAQGFRKQPKPAPMTIRIFDISTDPGCTQDFSAEGADLSERAATLFQEMETGK